MKRQGYTELPRFAVGALAIAGASAANAAVVQITFNNSFVSTTSGNQLDTDFGNDGIADLAFTLPVGGVNVYGALSMGQWGTGRVAGAQPAAGYHFLNVGNVQNVVPGSGGSLRGLANVNFSDNGLPGTGGVRFGFLDLTASLIGSDYRVTVNRLIYDDASATAPTGVTSATTGLTEVSPVPEASTSLGLLALGAGGLLTRRRQKRAA